MLASELVEILQKEIKFYGDREVIFCCECGSEETEIYPDTGFWSDDKGTKKYTLHCYECFSNFRDAEQTAGEIYY